MSTQHTGEPHEASEESVGPRPRSQAVRTTRSVRLLLAVAALLGLLAGVAWKLVTPLPAYLVGADGGATITERGLAGVYATDAWYVALGVLVGCLLGVVGWRRLAGLGWPMVFLVVIAALLAAGICWLVGAALGPNAFAERMAAARPGDQVPVDLTLRGPVAMLVWPFAAVAPVLVMSSLAPDTEEPTPVRLPWR